MFSGISERSGTLKNLPAMSDSLHSNQGYLLWFKPGQVIGVRERSKSLEVIQNSLAGLNHSKYPWLEWNESEMAGKFLSVPERSEIPENIKEQLIVELYSKN